jgi:hypothetical protein
MAISGTATSLSGFPSSPRAICRLRDPEPQHTLLMTGTLEFRRATAGNEGVRNPQSLSCPRHLFDSRARAVLSCTLVVGTVVALAPAIPAAIRSQVVFAALVTWTGTVVWGTICAAQLAGGSPRRDFATAATALAVIGVAVTVLAATHLEIIRVLYDRPALTWNIDWRFHLNHAQAIARYAGVDRALDYWGAPVAYHVGPAWLAGAAERVLGHGICAVSFGLVPLLCALSTTIATLYALHGHGIPYRLAAAAAAITMTLPWLNSTPRGVYWDVAARDLAVLANFSTYSGLMLNSSFGVAVGMASLALLFDRRSSGWQVSLASVGLASLVQLKPQFFVGVGLFAGVVGLERLIGRRASAPRSTRVLGAAIAALAMGLTFWAVLPSEVAGSSFARPVWAPGRTGYPLKEPFTNATLLFLLAIALWSAVDAPREQRRLIGVATATYIGIAAFPGLGAARVGLLFALAGASLVIARHRRPSGTVLCYGLTMRLAAVMSILVATLYLVSFPLRADVVVQVQRLVEPGFSSHRAQPDLAQALYPLQFLLVASAVGLLAMCAAQQDVWWRRAFCTTGALSVLSNVAFVSFHFARPLRGYEAAEDLGLLQTLQEVPRDSQLLIASDLADPAENYRRALRGVLLTGYTGHAFYVANLRYVHYTRPDAAQRLDELRAFFGSQWSAWHEGWLQDKGIGYILVSDRCPPIWLNQSGLPLRPLGRHGHWIGYEMRGARTPGPPAPMPAANEVAPRFGAQGCLSFRETGPPDVGERPGEDAAGTHDRVSANQSRAAALHGRPGWIVR